MNGVDAPLVANFVEPIVTCEPIEDGRVNKIDKISAGGCPVCSSDSGING